MIDIALLSPYPERLIDIIEENNCRITDDLQTANLIVSYGHRELIKEPILSMFRRRIVNIHLSYLPWNRGASPNFWSWWDNTPKGVSIHFVDAGIDTGPVILQRQYSDLFFGADATLLSSYNQLRYEAEILFSQFLPLYIDAHMIGNPLGSIRTIGEGSYHKKTDIDPIWPLLPKGWETPVSSFPGIKECFTNATTNN